MLKKEETDQAVRKTARVPGERITSAKAVLALWGDRGHDVARKVAGEGRGEAGEGGGLTGVSADQLCYGVYPCPENNKGPLEGFTHRRDSRVCGLESSLWRKDLEGAGGGREASVEAAIGRNTLTAFKPLSYTPIL